MKTYFSIREGQSQSTDKFVGDDNGGFILQSGIFQCFLRVQGAAGVDKDNVVLGQVSTGFFVGYHFG